MFLVTAARTFMHNFRVRSGKRIGKRSGYFEQDVCGTGACFGNVRDTVENVPD